jgi:hypothetical protein
MDRLMLLVQYASLAVLVVGYPLLVARDAVSDNQVMPGLGWPLALGLAGIGLVILVAAILRQRRWPMALPAATALGMMLYNGVYTWHEHGGANLSQQAMAEVRQQFPNARFYCLWSRPPQRELAIYLGRSVTAVDRFDQVPQPVAPGDQNLLLLRDDPRVQPPSGWVPAKHVTAGGRAYTLWQRSAGTSQP